MVSHVEGSFAGSGGLALYYQAWRCEGVPRANMVIVHGAGDHSGRFDRLVKPLVEGNLAVYGFDLRGFGRSPGKKGHILSWAEYREDVGKFLEFVRQDGPDRPVFLFGYSLGAAVVLDFLLKTPLKLHGAILSATPIEPVGVATPAQIFAARLLSRIWPAFTIRRTADIHGVSRDATILQELQVDPLHHDFVTARWGTEAMAVTDRIRLQAAEIRLPVLLIHGEDDPFNKVQGTQRFFDQITFPDKTLKVYPGSRHETHNDLDHAQVAADILAWILAHSA